MKSSEELQNCGSSESSCCAAEPGAGDDACLLFSEDGLGGRIVVKRGGAACDDGVELALWREVLEPGLLCQPAAFLTGFDVRLEEFGETADVAFGDADEEGRPVGAGWKQVVV